MIVTHLARDRLGPGGELFRACDGAPLGPLPPEYGLNDSAAASERPTFCRVCVAVARALGASRLTANPPLRTITRNL